MNTEYATCKIGKFYGMQIISQYMFSQEYKVKHTNFSFRGEKKQMIWAI